MVSQKQSPDSNKILALDIGATHYRLAIVENGQIIRKERIRTQSQNFLNFIRRTASDFLGNDKVSALGVSVAGSVYDNGECTKFPNIEGKPTLSLDDLKDISQPAFMINDASAAAYLQSKRYQSENIVFITISSGIGVGVISGGKIIHFDRKNREIGHRTMSYEIEMSCACGEKNHWEAYCSGKNVVSFYEKWSKEHDLEVFHFQSPQELFTASRDGNENVIRFLTEAYGGINRQAIQGIVETYKPELLIFGGAVCLENKSEIEKELIGKVTNLPKIIFAEEGDDVSLLGAASYATDKL